MRGRGGNTQGVGGRQTAIGANWAALNFSFGIDLHWNLITLRDCFFYLAFLFFGTQNRDKIIAKFLELPQRGEGGGRREGDTEKA